MTVSEEDNREDNMMDWLQVEKGRKYHSIASLFPLLEGAEFEALKTDIAENGLIEPIWLHPDGSILDGRNRHRACIEAGVRPRFETRNNGKSLVAFVVSKNLHRRHLTYDQRVGIALKLEPAFAEEAKERMLAGGPAPNSEQGRAAEQAAQEAQVGKSAVYEMKAVAQDKPDIADKLITGETTVRKERKEYKEKKREPKPVPAPAEKSPRLIVAKAESTGLPSDSVDLIITSPPYNLGSENWPMGGQGREPREDGIGYSDGMTEEAYQAWQIECLCEMYRVAKDGASLFYNHKVRSRDGQMVHPLTWLLLPDNPWMLRQEIVWDRGSTHNHSPTLFWPEDERIYWMTKDAPVLPNHPIGMSTVWRFHGPVAGTWHPAPFSEELPERCIKAVGRDGITVLDPFVGSCTTLKVALRYGYDAIGVDISQEYLDIAKKENGWSG